MIQGVRAGVDLLRCDDGGDAVLVDQLDDTPPLEQEGELVEVRHGAFQLDTVDQVDRHLFAGLLEGGEERFLDTLIRAVGRISLRVDAGTALRDDGGNGVLVDHLRDDPAQHD